MKSLLVALMVHLLGTGSTPMVNGKPVYVVPAGMLGAQGKALPLTTSEAFGPTERRKWEVVAKLAGGLPVATELCYRAAYRDFKAGITALDKAEREELLLHAGGHHGLARVAVRWCNASLRKMDILPLGHPELVRAERSVREAGYMDDLAFLKACKGNNCDALARSFGREVVGVPLDAEK